MDQHRTALIQKVSHIDPILDELVDMGVISQECCNAVRAQSTPQNKMRELYAGALNTNRGKDAYYEILREQQPFITEDIEESVLKGLNSCLLFDFDPYQWQLVISPKWFRFDQGSLNFVLLL